MLIILGRMASRRMAGREEELRKTSFSRKAKPCGVFSWGRGSWASLPTWNVFSAKDSKPTAVRPLRKEPFSAKTRLHSRYLHWETPVSGRISGLCDVVAKQPGLLQEETEVWGWETHFLYILLSLYPLKIRRTELNAWNTLYGWNPRATTLQKGAFGEGKKHATFYRWSQKQKFKILSQATTTTCFLCVHRYVWCNLKDNRFAVRGSLV